MARIASSCGQPPRTPGRGGDPRRESGPTPPGTRPGRAREKAGPRAPPYLEREVGVRSWGPGSAGLRRGRAPLRVCCQHRLAAAPALPLRGIRVSRSQPRSASRPPPPALPQQPDSSPLPRPFASLPSPPAVDSGERWPLSEPALRLRVHAHTSPREALS